MKTIGKIILLCYFCLLLTGCQVGERISTATTDPTEITRETIQLLDACIKYYGVTDLCFSPRQFLSPDPIGLNPNAAEDTPLYSASWSLQRLFPGYITERDFTTENGSAISVEYILQETVVASKYLQGKNFTAMGHFLDDGGWAYFILPTPDAHLSDIPLSEAFEIVSKGLQDASAFRLLLPIIQFDGVVTLPETVLADGTTIKAGQQAIQFVLNDYGVNTQERSTGQYLGERYSNYTDIILDRPFIYAIQDSKGSLVYVGIFANDTQSIE